VKLQQREIEERGERVGGEDKCLVLLTKDIDQLKTGVQACIYCPYILVKVGYDVIY
jgi:hypothetical protein